MKRYNLSKIKRLVITALIMIFCVCLAFAQSLSGIPAAFVDVGIGARVMAMGGAGTALSQDATSLIWNPANMLLSESKYHINVEYLDLYTMYNYSYFGATALIEQGFKAGFAVLYSGDDAMSETTIYLSTAFTGKYIHEYFDIWADGFTIAPTLKIHYASFGNNPDGALVNPSTGLNHQVTGSSLGFAFDVGLNFRATEKNILATMWKNPISYQSWSSKNEVGTAKGRYSENLPPQLLFGFVRLEDRFNIALQLEKSIHLDTDDSIALGIEFHVIPRVMDIRAGFSNELLSGENKKYSCGIGFSIPFVHSQNLSLDIAYQIQTNWKKNNTLHFALGYAF
jgi:hypothetical protein